MCEFATLRDFGANNPAVFIGDATIHLLHNLVHKGHSFVSV